MVAPVLGSTMRVARAQKVIGIPLAAKEIASGCQEVNMRALIVFLQGPAIDQPLKDYGMEKGHIGK